MAETVAKLRRETHTAYSEAASLRLRAAWLYYNQGMTQKDVAEKLGISSSKNPWDRHHYEATLPGFGLGDSMDWRAFVSILKEKGFSGPFEIENEAVLSKQTGKMGAIVQGCKAAVQNLAPLLWELSDEGWTYPSREYTPLKDLLRTDVPLVTMDDL